MFESGGMLHLRARLDPETGAPIKAAIEALVSDVLRRREGVPGTRPTRQVHVPWSRPPACTPAPTVRRRGRSRARTRGSVCDGPVIGDDRTIPQLQADALAALARHTLGCTQASTPLAKTTVIVRMNLETLVEGIGHASIDGLDQPISAATASRLAADAEVIPAVLGGERVPLDLGRATRLFTKAQRLALGERDGGCASCGQNIGVRRGPPYPLVATRRRPDRPRERGAALLVLPSPRSIARTGAFAPPVMRCGSSPPPHIDPARTPRLGGKARFALPDALVA